VRLRQIGVVEPITTIAVKAQVGGELIKVLFTEGQDVKKGQELCWSAVILLSGKYPRCWRPSACFATFIRTKALK
jgi:hypothetical protein